MNAKYSDSDIIRLRKAIEESLAWGDASSWHSKMFNELSDKVFESTQVMLSLATLKRFFGVVKHDGVPSVTTLDALSQFIGKENWRDFKTSKPTPMSVIKTPRKSVYITVGFVLALVTISLIGNRTPELVINSSEFSFSSKVLSKEYPNSVLFDFTVPQSLRVDSLKIQQYWDPTKTIDVSKNQTQATGIYYFPGYFQAKLLVDGQLALAHDLFLKSNGWLGLIEYNPIPKYFEPQLKESSKISIPESIFNEVKSLDAPVETSFHYIDDLGKISGDDFQFTATIQNTFDDRWAVCQSLRIYFIGTDGAMIIPFSKIGCSSENNLMLNDVYLNGKENDLSSLNADFSEPTGLEISIVNKEMTIAINGDNVYSKAYKETMGELVGLRFKFQGLGEVLNFKIMDNNGEEIAFPSS